uniref:Uncharacterized protein n=1 Tax=viral metagenome TaxID=1070528 RepID=A0A6C0E9Q8_9ZZZZ
MNNSSCGLNKNTYNFSNTAIKGLNDKIDNFIETYAPTNLSIPGNVTLGTNESNSLTLNSVATFKGDAFFNASVSINDTCTIDTLTITNDVTVGQDDTDTLTVNSTSTFENPVTMKNSLTVDDNVVLGVDDTNTVTVAGTVIATKVQLPRVNGNAVNIANSDAFVYAEYSSAGNIYTDFPDAVLVYVKNTAVGTNYAITYNDEATTVTVNAGTTRVFLRTSATAYTPLHVL